MSKKASVSEGYDRKRKMEREAEVERRKNNMPRKKSGRPKMAQNNYTRGHFRYDEDEYEYEA